jgi:SecD/SecF fusion protein
MQNRARNALVLALVAGLVLASLVVTVGIPGAVKAKPTRLGLDLKGGVQLTYQARPTTVAKVTSESIERAIEVMRKRVDQLGVAQPEIQRSGTDEVVVSLPDVQNVKRAEEEVGKTAQLYFYDWEPNVIGPNGQPAETDATVTGGVNPGQAATGLNEYRAVLRAAKRPVILPPRNSDIASYQKGCTLALNEASTGPNAGCIYGSWYLLDSAHEKVLRGDEPTRADLFKDYTPPAGAKPQVVHINPGTVIVRALAQTSGEGKVTNGSPESWYVLNDNPALTGSSITHPQAGYQNGGSGAPNVNFGFTSEGRTKFEKVTREIAKRGERLWIPGQAKQDSFQHFAIVLENQLITVPYIDWTQNPEGIDASNGSEITGNFTTTSAQNLADELTSGALPVKLNLISESQVSATLGSQALNQGLLAGLVGLIVVAVFLVVFYRVLGLIAVGGLAIYGLYLFALIKLIPVTLTLPGIAGVILTIGVAADANIVIFERIKEEIRGGRSVAAGIVSGYKHGFAAIIDANVVTFMTAFILFALATAEVQGFAFMLGLGVLVSLFTAVLATQAALGSMGRLPVIRHPRALGAGPKRRGWRFDFMGSSRWFFTLSGTILLVGALAIGARGLNFGIDFKSGTRIQTTFPRALTQGQIRSVMAADGYPDAQIQRFTSKGGTAGYQISVKRLGPQKLQTVRSDLERKLSAQRLSATSVGPTFGTTVANEAVIAIIASLLVISAYIALRFEWKYAVPVLIALAHDLLITTGVYALTGREVTAATVAALLTILGYSMYDTIIVFDRIRENVPRMARASFSQIVNRSMAEVLTRSLATSFCTLLPVTALLAFGGATLKDFAFALLVGIASGAYSSIFIASPVLTHWKEREPAYRNRRARLIRELGRVPAYAGVAGVREAREAAATAETEERARRNRRGRLVVAEQPGEQISQAEFDDLVRDLDIEEAQRAEAAREPVGGGGSSSRRSGGAAATIAERKPALVAPPPEPAAPARAGEPAAEQPLTAPAGAPSAPAAPPAAGADGEAEVPDGQTSVRPAPDATPEELVLKDSPTRRPAGRRRNRKHGRRR